MGIRALVAAAAVMVGVGQPEAATVQQEMLFTITKAERVYSDGHNYYVYNYYPSFWGVEVGETVIALVTTDYNDAIINHIVQVAGRIIFHDDLETAPGGLWKGFTYDLATYSWTDAVWNGVTGIVRYTSDHRPYYDDIEASLTPAPVPLPAAAALLPMGIGAFAVLRKRRRSLG